MPDRFLPPPPSRTVSLLVSTGLVAVWAWVRLVYFDTMVFPLTYVIPLLVCVWTRDRVALWAMAGVFATLHVVKLYWLLPVHVLTPEETTASLFASVANVTVGAVAVHLIIRLRDRLEQALVEVRTQADELRTQSEELAQQNEELAEQTEELSSQTEELSQQGEALASQNEELQSQAEEIGLLNANLERRERLLGALIETAHLPHGEQAVLDHTATAAFDLFGELLGGGSVTTAVYETHPRGFRLRAQRGGAMAPETGEPLVADPFATLVLGEGRTAALNDTSLRTDLQPAAVPGGLPVRAGLYAPIRTDTEITGVLAIQRSHPHDWSDEEFRLATWLADQCGRALLTLRAQSDLREADRRKSEFLATLSHELRNPLAPIRFALTLLEKGHAQDGRILRIMQRQLGQLIRLVDDLLDVTRLGSNKIHLRRDRVDLAAVVRQTIEAWAPGFEAAQHEFVSTLPSSPVWLEADAERLEQVVANLLSNAARYTPSGGRVSIDVSTLDGHALLRVADTGVGLTADDQARVFEMFTQVGGPGSGGLGIGLAIVRGIVELHGGRIEAVSEGPGRGTEFRVCLPIGNAPPARAAGDGVPSALPASRHVLIVDDNADAATTMGSLLELHGHTVAIAHDAGSALAAIEQRVPDVALLDIGLPAMDGYGLAQQLRRSHATRHVRLVAVTGWGQDADLARSREAGFDLHLTKPAEPDAIMAAVAESPWSEGDPRSNGAP